ncbi:Sau3AI family type II restriction endonuclease [Enorma phocaeensis]|uniref:Sau3AI family type II restriction endonuclease n=1 Tax=Enorma phocaeensis TaxID=1871019 RepID=UPI002356D647|nr:Sau3AI family type II restriction endonuclease [Enorma phocaeensis]
MHVEHTDYDASSLASILEYAKQLEGKTLREACNLDDIEDSHKRKGSFGDALEEYYFHYANNSDPNPDFVEVSTELKSTPLKVKRNGDYSAKERLVISLINYMSVVGETWETSSLQKKLRHILLVAYQYDKDLNPVDFLIKIVELWGIPEEDLPTFKHDWDTVVDKIRAGRAHELSGSDTLYLEAATKASSSKDRRPQPYSPIPAKPRAWAIKQSYMTVTFNHLLHVQSIRRTRDEGTLDLLELVKRRFEPYTGLTEEELAEVCGYSWAGRRKPKNLCALITKHILGVDEDLKIAEFEKAGIKAKTMRLKRNGVPKESISFPAFSYFDLAERAFEESDFLGYLRQKYLFVIYREDRREHGTFHLSEVLFWQMPDADIVEAKRCYEEMQRRVRAGHAERSVTSTENRCCHVRPHGRNKADTLPTPYGSEATKKCFWINARYIGEEIDRVKRADSRSATSRRAHGLGDEVAKNTIRVAELFAGVGGFRLGLEGYQDPDHPEFDMPAAGPFVTVWANQWEPPGAFTKQFAARCYRKRFGDDSVVNQDIHAVLDAYEDGAIDIPDVDMVVGGFPCQDYSVAKPLAQAEGIVGKKGVLWWDIYRFLQLKGCPRFVLLENVDRLLKSPASQRGRDFAIILSCFATLGYAVEWRVVNGAQYGFPQKRRRVYIYAEKADSGWNLEDRIEHGVIAEAFPAEISGDMRCIELLSDPYENSEEFGVGLKQSPFENAGCMQGGTVVTVAMSPVFDGPKMTLGDVLVPDEEVPEEYYVDDEKLEKWQYLKGGKKEPRVNKRTGFEYLYSEGAMAFPDPVDAPARTILTSEGGGSASRSKHIVQVGDGRYRRLVPDELDQLQGFPKGWTDTGMSDIQRAFCMGNALIVGIPHRIGEVIARRTAEED